MSATVDSGIQSIEGYDLQAEKARYRFPDLRYGGKSLNRGTATVDIDGDMNPPAHQATRDEHDEWLLTTTHPEGAPVLELGYPTAGSYVACGAGVYMDLVLGCAQKILDEHHPRFAAAIDAMAQYGLLFRREIAADEYLVAADGVTGLRTPQDLARLHAATAQRAFPSAEGYRVFLSNSGAEAVEAALKICYRVAYDRFVASHGLATLARVMEQLGIERLPALDRPSDPDDPPLWREYPFAVVGAVGAFHGRTLGALAATCSKKVHRLGYPTGRWTRHVTYNGDVEQLVGLLDRRPIATLLEAEGGIARVVAEGRLPVDLVAGLVVEGLQGEGGYVPGDPTWLAAVAGVCREHDILLVADEVQTFGRTGRIYAFEHFGVSPDVIAMAKSAVVGVTVARRELAGHLSTGWHANTWGGGKIFDTNLAHATLEALVDHRDPVLDGRTYCENASIKGLLLRSLLERLAEKHPAVLVGIDGMGLVNAITVHRRRELIALAWRRGLKLLGCGAPADDGTARIRILFLADALTKEIEDFVQTLDGVIQELETR